MKNTSMIILAGAVLAGLAYAVGKRNGHNECLYECQEALVKVILKEESKEEA